MVKEVLSKDLVVGNTYYDIDPTIDKTASKLMFHSRDLVEHLIAFELIGDSVSFIAEDGLVNFDYDPEEAWFELI